MSSKQLFFEAILDFSFGTPAFDRDIRMDFSVNLFVESDSPPAIVSIAELFGTGATNCSALHRKLQSHALSSPSAADLAVIWSVKADDKFSSLHYLYPFHGGVKSEFPPTLDNMRPSGHYAWDTRRRFREFQSTLPAWMCLRLGM